MERETLTVNEAATLLGVSNQTVRWLWKKGELEGYKKTSAPNSPIVLYADNVARYIEDVQGAAGA
jgi:transposase